MSISYFLFKIKFNLLTEFFDSLNSFINFSGFFISVFSDKWSDKVFKYLSKFIWTTISSSFSFSREINLLNSLSFSFIFSKFFSLLFLISFSIFNTLFLKFFFSWASVSSFKITFLNILENVKNFWEIAKFETISGLIFNISPIFSEKVTKYSFPNSCLKIKTSLFPNK